MTAIIIQRKYNNKSNTDTTIRTVMNILMQYIKKKSCKINQLFERFVGSNHI